MKVAWIYPRRQRCGISLYSERYLAALDGLVDILQFDVEDNSLYSGRDTAELKACDLVHVQYETAFFLRGGRDLFARLAARLRRPLVVTLHEVYEQFPGVFPRQAIRGRGLVRKAKEWIYDLRHSAQTAYSRHGKNHFWAKRIFVHYPYQKLICEKQVIPAGLVDVLAHPVAPVHLGETASPAVTADASAVRLGATGFINPNYDYQLLFQSLSALDMPWHFTWIGGLRRDEDSALLENLRQSIHGRGWDGRFEITGWVSDEKQEEMLSQLDVYLALFANRSTSGSLLAALGSKRMVVATRLALIEDLNRERELVACVNKNARQVAAAIKKLYTDAPLRQRLGANIVDYVQKHTYAEMAKQLVKKYEEILWERRDP